VRGRRITTDLDPIDCDEADPNERRKRNSRQSDPGLDPEYGLVVDELGRHEYAEDPDGAELADPAKRHDEAPATAGPDPAQRGCICLWCGSGFQRRQDGGKLQRFCSKVCRSAFYAACRAWAAQAVFDGTINLDTIRGGLPRNVHVRYRGK
jgi:hypothetical protein